MYSVLDIPLKRYSILIYTLKLYHLQVHITDLEKLSREQIEMALDDALSAPFTLEQKMELVHSGESKGFKERLNVVRDQARLEEDVELCHRNMVYWMEKSCGTPENCAMVYARTLLNKGIPTLKKFAAFHKVNGVKFIEEELGIDNEHSESISAGLTNMSQKMTMQKFFVEECKFSILSSKYFGEKMVQEGVVGVLDFEKYFKNDVGHIWLESLLPYNKHNVPTIIRALVNLKVITLPEHMREEEEKKAILEKEKAEARVKVKGNSSSVSGSNSSMNPNDRSSKYNPTAAADGNYTDQRRRKKGHIKKVEFSNGCVYFGECNRSDKPDGQGTLTFPNGETHEGWWKDGKRI